MKKLVLQLEEDEEENEVMPGFRFHPTEEELVEFYLRRKVEGKRFNVELIAFLDLYRYDPWELPALAAAIGDEKEWYFYVPRDKKYRNGDRPNRVTTSGYWKATGADRIIRPENSSSSTSIGLKKTLVFYSGKAPKGIRTTWIMNEYRLPHHPLQKAEISLCRVYKRGGGGASAASPSPSSSTPCSVFGINDDLQKIINNNYHQNQMQCNPNTDVVVFASSNAMQPPHQQPSLPYSHDQNEEDRLWAWNSISKDYNHIFN